MSTAPDSPSSTRTLQIITLPPNRRGRSVALNLLVSDVGRMLQRHLPKNVTLEQDLAAGLPEIETDPRQTAQLVVRLAASLLNGCEDTGTLSISTSTMARRNREQARPPGTKRGHVVRLRLCMVGSSGAGEMSSKVLERQKRESIPPRAASSDRTPKPRNPSRNNVAVVLAVEKKRRGPTVTMLIPTSQPIRVSMDGPCVALPMPTGK